jgi:hypothetical protein
VHWLKDELYVALVGEFSIVAILIFFFTLPIVVIMSQAYYNSMFPTSTQWTQELAGWKEGTRQWAFLEECFVRNMKYNSLVLLIVNN